MEKQGLFLLALDEILRGKKKRNLQILSDLQGISEWIQGILA